MSHKMATLCLDAGLETLHLWGGISAATFTRDLHLCRRLHKGSPSLPPPSQGISISAATFTRDLLRLYRLLRCSRHAVPSKTAHSLLSRGSRSALPESQSSALMKARRFLRSHPWVVLAFWVGTESCWKTHSWPLKVMWRCSTTPCSTPSWYTHTPVSPLSLDNIKVVTELTARPNT